MKILYLFAIAVTLASSFNCSAQARKNDKSSKKDASEKTSRSIDNSNQNPNHKILTIDIINKTSDDSLLWVIADNLFKKILKDYKKEYQTVMTFSKPRQAIYMIWELEAEINNGGFNQYYFNSSGQFAKLTPDALRLVGAVKFSELVSKANKIFETENKKITKNQDGTLDGFSKSYEDNPLNKFDDEFYKLYKTENLEQLQIAFIRKHKAEFVDK